MTEVGRDVRYWWEDGILQYKHALWERRSQQRRRRVSSDASASSDAGQTVGTHSVICPQVVDLLVKCGHPHLKTTDRVGQEGQRSVSSVDDRGGERRGGAEGGGSSSRPCR